MKLLGLQPSGKVMEALVSCTTSVLNFLKLVRKHRNNITYMFILFNKRNIKNTKSIGTDTGMGFVGKVGSGKTSDSSTSRDKQNSSLGWRTMKQERVISKSINNNGCYRLYVVKTC